VTVFSDIKRRPRRHEPHAAMLLNIFHHALNRGNQRVEISETRFFTKMATLKRSSEFWTRSCRSFLLTSSTIAGFQTIGTWHMVLKPREDGAMGRLLYWVTMTHTALSGHSGGTFGDTHKLIFFDLVCCRVDQSLKRTTNKNSPT